MFFGDIVLFMGVWLAYLLTFYVALFVVYPRSGANMLPHVASFNNWYTALFALIDLSFIGEKVEFKLLWEEGAFDGHQSGWQYADLFAWLVLYYLFMLVSLVLLVNLLIAMMSETYSTVFSNATLQSRLSLAAHLIKLELLAHSFGMRVRVGEETTPGSAKWAYVFRAIDRNPNDDSDSEDGYEGDFANGGSDPFAPPLPSPHASTISMLRDTRDELSARLAAIEQRLPPKGEGGVEGGEQPAPWYATVDRAAVVARAAKRAKAAIHPCNKMLRQQTQTVNAVQPSLAAAAAVASIAATRSFSPSRSTCQKKATFHHHSRVPAGTLTPAAVEGVASQETLELETLVEAVPGDA